MLRVVIDRYSPPVAPSSLRPACVPLIAMLLSRSVRQVSVALNRAASAAAAIRVTAAPVPAQVHTPDKRKPE